MEDLRLPEGLQERLKREIGEAVRKDNEQIEELLLKVRTLEAENLKLRTQIGELREVQLMKELQEGLKTVEMFVQHYLKVEEMLDEAAPILTNRRRMAKRGESHLSYRRDVRTEDLVREYQGNGNKITPEMCRRYEMSKNGIKKRILTTGVYVGRGGQSRGQEQEQQMEEAGQQVEKEE